ncbi:uncharacterized protein LOC122261380 [Penaeus japonicus]|uniref:uncharacterized protein LOC122261380 n=1 Tax=Penaeus japonicus TaxID=27405 RepID=UPI001C712B03|nr:uncharacterized protein LOC122261380 [Penaeus japonicus]
MHGKASLFQSKALTSDSDHAPARKATKTYIRCFTCRKKSTGDRLTKHLIFGEVECALCRLIIIACRTFNEETSSSLSSGRICNHQFEFTKPFEHLYVEISQKTKGKNSDKLPAATIAKKFSNYLSKLKSLEMEEPWMSAILLSYERLEVFRFHESYNHKEVNNNEDIPGGYPFNDSEPASLSLQDECAPSSKGDMDNIIISSPYRISDFSVSELRVAEDSPADSLYSSADREPESRPRALKPRKTSDSTSEPKATPFERQPSEPTTPTSGPKATPHETHPRKPSGSAPIAGPKTRVSSEPRAPELVVTGFLDTPADGYYYVSRRAIEECPMCYAELCPSRFTVNVQTFLLTTVCIGCGLAIYLVFDPPDGSLPKVAIVTGNKDLRTANPDTKTNGKKEKKNKRS